MIPSTRGLTIVELMVVIGILAILAGFALPNVINWRSNAALRGAANNLKGDLELAKARAIRANHHVAVLFHAPDRYEIFLDNGAGTEGIASNWTRDGAEPLLRDREMSAGVRIDLGSTSFGTLGDRTRFNGRGHCTTGSAFLENSQGVRMRLSVSRLGQITITRP